MEQPGGRLDSYPHEMEQQMTQPRSDALTNKLERGIQKTLETLNALTPEQWQQTIYTEPKWQVRQILAHFVSAEKQLLILAQNTAGGGQGAPLGFDIDQYNAAEQKRLEGQSVQNLLEQLAQTRQQVIQWVQTLNPTELDQVGRHPALGEVTVEMMIAAMHGHHLLHLRDLARLQKTNTDR
jgi:hypothetical protein